MSSKFFFKKLYYLISNYTSKFEILQYPILDSDNFRVSFSTYLHPAITVEKNGLSTGWPTYSHQLTDSCSKDIYNNIQLEKYFFLVTLQVLQHVLTKYRNHIHLNNALYKITALRSFKLKDTDLKEGEWSQAPF